MLLMDAKRETADFRIQTQNPNTLNPYPGPFPGMILVQVCFLCNTCPHFPAPIHWLGSEGIRKGTCSCGGYISAIIRIDQLLRPTQIKPQAPKVFLTEWCPS